MPIRKLEEINYGFRKERIASDPIYKTDVLRYGIYLVEEKERLRNCEDTGRLSHDVYFVPEEMTVWLLEWMRESSMKSSKAKSWRPALPEIYLPTFEEFLILERDNKIKTILND